VVQGHGHPQSSWLEVADEGQTIGQDRVFGNKGAIEVEREPRIGGLGASSVGLGKAHSIGYAHFGGFRTHVSVYFGHPFRSISDTRFGVFGHLDRVGH
jgi:hypothetical protein